MPRAAVELQAVGKAFGTTVAVDGVDLAVEDGEFLSLLGPSGCGKTTTLNLVAGFLAPTRGRVLIGGEDVTGRPPHLRDLGVVFQNYALFPHMTVSDNIAFGLRMRGVGRREIERRVAEALALVRLEGRGSMLPAHLSGGMQQRVALARALVIQPRVLLLDEPLAALDKKLREEMRAELRDIQRTVGIATVFVTHDQQEALGLSDRVAVMAGGRIAQAGTPREVYDRPSARFVADFIGASNTFPARVLSVGPEAAELEGDGVGRLRVHLGPGARPPAAGDAVELLIRPERIALVGSGDHGVNTFPGRVVGLTYLGSVTEARVALAGGRRVLVTLDEHKSPAPAEGAAVHVALPPGAFLLF